MSTGNQGLGALAGERHYTPKEVAEMWNVSEATVRRTFQDRPEVLKFDFPRAVHNSKRRTRTMLRIPASVLARVHEERSRGFGAKVQTRGGGIK